MQENNGNGYHSPVAICTGSKTMMANCRQLRIKKPSSNQPEGKAVMAMEDGRWKMEK